MLKILSYNVNGIRSAMQKGLVEWLAAESFDIVCLQETKAHVHDIPTLELQALGYHCYFHSAEKKGYSGVAILSKKAPVQIVAGCGIEKYDREGRFLRADFGQFSVLNSYFPSGTTGDERQNFKFELLYDFEIWMDNLKKEHPQLIVVGDYNIAHTEKDIHNAKSNQKTSGFLPEERAWMSKWFASGFTDAFRKVHPDKIEYSWWSFRANARAKNKGWRIDYQSVTDNLADRVHDLRHLTQVFHSDHCPVLLEIEI